MNTSDPKAARAFVSHAYGAYGPELRRYLHRRLKNKQDVRDLAQEVWRRLMRIKEPSEVLEPLAYIYRAAANVIAEYHLLRRRDCVVIDSDAVDHAAEHPQHVAQDEIADDLARQAEMMRILATLPKTLREVLVGRVQEGLSYEQIGVKLGLTPKTVEQYFYRAMTLVRKHKRDSQQHG